jgi:hypothetical protein
MEITELQIKLDDARAKLASVEKELSAPGLSISNSRLTRALYAPKLRFLLICADIVLSTAAYAAVVGVPNTFSNGTIADANEVNANFDVLVSESNDQDARLASLGASLAALTTNVGTITTDIASNASLEATKIPQARSTPASVAASTTRRVAPIRA